MSFYDEMAMEYGTTYHEMDDLLNCVASWEEYED